MFTEKQVDIIKEVINIGIGEAAFALSELVKDRVIIKVPDLRIMESAKLADYLQDEMKLLGVYISQNFQGKISGKSILCYSHEATRSLLEVITGKKMETLTLSDSDRATLQEIGNLILVSCLSSISNTIKDRFRFDMPHVALNGQVQYFENMLQDMLEFDYAVIIKTEMAVKENNIRGYVFILLGFKELVSIIEGLEQKIKGG